MKKIDNIPGYAQKGKWWLKEQLHHQKSRRNREMMGF